MRRRSVLVRSIAARSASGSTTSAESNVRRPASRVRHRVRLGVGEVDRLGSRVLVVEQSVGRTEIDDLACPLLRLLTNQLQPPHRHGRHPPPSAIAGYNAAPTDGEPSTVTAGVAAVTRPNGRTTCTERISTTGERRPPAFDDCLSPLTHGQARPRSSSAAARRRAPSRAPVQRRMRLVVAVQSRVGGGAPRTRHRRSTCPVARATSRRRTLRTLSAISCLLPRRLQTSRHPAALRSALLSRQRLIHEA